MSKIKNDGLDQYGAKPFEQQQFETAGVEGVNIHCLALPYRSSTRLHLILIILRTYNIAVKLQYNISVMFLKVNHKGE